MAISFFDNHQCDNIRAGNNYTPNMPTAASKNNRKTSAHYAEHNKIYIWRFDLNVVLRSSHASVYVENNICVCFRVIHSPWECQMILRDAIIFMASVYI